MHRLMRPSCRFMTDCRSYAGNRACSWIPDRRTSFETNVPYNLRCRAALIALPSRYPDAASAIAESPDESKRDLHRTFQQFTLYLTISEAIIFLHRPYFARALHDAVPDPTLSMFGQSYLTVVERCNVSLNSPLLFRHLSRS